MVLAVTDQSIRAIPSKSISVLAVTERPAGDSKRILKTTWSLSAEISSRWPLVQRVFSPFTRATGLKGPASSWLPAELTPEAKAVVEKVYVLPHAVICRPFSVSDVFSGVHGLGTRREIPARDPSQGTSPGHLS